MAEIHNEPVQDTSAASAAEDLNILFPDHEIMIAGEKITVKEYPFMTWLHLKTECLPILNDFADLADRNEDILLDEILESFENHFHILQNPLCISINKPNEFLEKLSDDEMSMLLLTWWQTNKHFFQKSATRLLRAKANQSAGQTSSNV